MKSLHRTKALAAYDGARLAVKNDLAYPSYMMLKEAARGVLSYIAEDELEQDISEKTKLTRLLELIDTEGLNPDDLAGVNKLIELEQGGLVEILSVPMDELRKVKKAVKHFIVLAFGEPV